MWVPWVHMGSIRPRCGSHGFTWAASGLGVWVPSRGMGSHGQQQSVGPLQFSAIVRQDNIFLECIIIICMGLWATRVNNALCLAHCK